MKRLFRVTASLVSLLHVFFHLSEAQLQDLVGSVSICPQSYRVIGPFPHAARQLADPTQAFKTNSIGVPLDEFLPSEFGKNGTVGWHKVATSGCSISYNFPDIRWDLMTGPFGQMGTELQGWAIGKFNVTLAPGSQGGAARRFLARGLGTRTFFLDSTAVHGDRYRRGHFATAVELEPGEHFLAVPFVGSGGSMSFSITLQPLPSSSSDSSSTIPPPAAEIITTDLIVPDVVDGFLPGRSLGHEGRDSGNVTITAYAGIPIRNLSPKDWLENVTISVMGTDGWVVGKGVVLHPGAPGTTRISPGRTLPLHVMLEQRADQPCPDCITPTCTGPNCRVRLTVTVRSQGQVVAETSFLTMSCRSFFPPVSSTPAGGGVRGGPPAGYKFTFLDADASVTYAGLVPPLNPCPIHKFGVIGCPVLVTAHGAGVEAGDRPWMSSYELQAYAWILLPTNRRAFGYDWQGPGLRNALAAISALQASEFPPGVPLEEQVDAEEGSWRVDVRRRVFAGHSMGGHGCLVLATHFPGALLGAACAAGWIKEELYPPALLRTDSSLRSPWLRGLFEAALGEYDVDFYLPNLVGIPTVVRMGEEDKNVPPFHLLRVARILDQLAHDPSHIKVSEVPKKGHWWDGVVDDVWMQKFFDARLKPDNLPAIPEEFLIRCSNPATHGGREGVRILQLRVPYRGAHVHVNTSLAQPWVLTTENIQRLSLTGSALAHAKTLRKVVIDDTIVDLVGTGADEVVLTCTGQGHRGPCVWRLENGNSQWRRLERSPGTYGPAAQVFEGPLVIVYGDETWMKEVAEFLAHDLYVQGQYSVSAMAADEPASIWGLREYSFQRPAKASRSMRMSPLATTLETVTVADIVASGRMDMNMILIGGPSSNKATHQVVLEWERELGISAMVRFAPEGGSFNIGQDSFTRPGVGVQVLGPVLAGTSNDKVPRLALVIAGTDDLGSKMAADIFAGPRGFVSGMTIPDYLVIGENFKWGGADGIQAAGFWDNEWRPSLLCGTLAPYFPDEPQRHISK